MGRSFMIADIINECEERINEILLLQENLDEERDMSMAQLEELANEIERCETLIHSLAPIEYELRQQVRKPYYLG